MKVLLALHGYPPELVGGTEKAVQNLAHGLSRRGHEVCVVAGSMQHQEGFRTSVASEAVPGGGQVRVRRIHRADLFFDHWQKSASARAAGAFREILREERPDVVHVHHWIRLSRDLVWRAALEGIPALVTLHDLWTSCLIGFRVRPESGEFCEVELGPEPCLNCAAQVPPRTPWVPVEAQHLELARRRADLLRELRLARSVLVPTRSHGETVLRFLGVGEDRPALTVVPHGRELSLTRRDPPPVEGRLLLGAWGHVHPLKGLDRILEAIARTRDPRAITLHVAGAEPFPAYARRVHDLAAGLDVVFHGPFDAAELDRHPVSAVHAMISGTRASESWGLVVDEAVALGVPMVLPRSGAFAERLEEGRGVLFYDPTDEADLVRLLDGLLEDPAGLGKVRDALPEPGAFLVGVERHAELVEALYADAIEGGAPEAAPLDWWADRMQLETEKVWDESLGRTPPEESGLA